MANETRALADYAAGLRYEHISADALRRAKDCLIDSIACMLYAQKASWTRIVIDQIRARGETGRSHFLGTDLGPIRAESAALGNGILTHAWEIDCLRKPGAGVHPGATLVPAAIAAAQERHANGKALLTSIVAGCEVMFRIGNATKHTAEPRGFHSPGLTGTFGAAVSAGFVFGISASAMANALGIAGSMSAGLLEFSAGHGGGMVKRLHMGRAAESGIMAARWADAGFSGPPTVLEGKHGFLNAFCDEKDIPALVRGLGTDFEILNLCLKRYPCHITSHTAVRAVELLRGEHKFAGSDVSGIVVETSKRMAELNSNKSASDQVAVQYTIPFCVAVALDHDTTDPDSWGEEAFGAAETKALRKIIDVIPRQSGDGVDLDWTSTIHITLKDGRQFERHQSDFPGTPTTPLNPDQLGQKFTALTRHLRVDRMADLLERLEKIEDEPDLDWLTGSNQ